VPASSSSTPTPRSAGTLLAWLCAAEFGVLLLGFLLGLAGFYRENPAPPWGDEEAFQIDALRFAADILFTLRPSMQLTQSSWALNAAAFTFPVAVSLLVAALAGFFARNSFRRFMIRRRGEHSVVVGSAATAGFVFAWNKPTIWVRPGPISLALRAAMPGHAALLSGRLDDPRAQGGAAILTARRILLLNADGASNVRTALSLLGALSAPRSAAWRGGLHVAVNSAALVDEFERRLAPLALPAGAEVQVFQMHALGVRNLFLQGPAERLRFVGRDEVARVVLVGLGSWGEEVLKSLLLEGHPVAPRSTEIFIIDRDAAYLERVFAENHQDKGMLPAINWVPLDVVNAQAFGRWLDNMVELPSPPCAYFICLGDGELSYATALRLESGLKERLIEVSPIYFHQQQDHDSEMPTHREASSLRPFGSAREGLDEEMVLQVRRDALARRIHDHYLAMALQRGARIGDRPALREWDRLPYTLKRENRSQADHHLYKLRQIGCRVRDGGGGKSFAFEQDELEKLAAAEHSRWCASRLVAGWRHGVARDDDKKIHPDLVSYEALGEAVRELDRDAIRNLPALFGEMKWDIVRDLPFTICLPVDTWQGDSAMMVRQASSLVLEKYPDRFPLLLLRIGDRNERLFGLAWRQAGGIFRIVSDEPVHLLIERTEVPERLAMAELVRHAETNLALRGAEASCVMRFLCKHELVVDAGKVRWSKTGCAVEEAPHG
jgi:hypothetical protein